MPTARAASPVQDDKQLSPSHSSPLRVRFQQRLSVRLRRSSAPTPKRKPQTSEQRPSSSRPDFAPTQQKDVPPHPPNHQLSPDSTCQTPSVECPQASKITASDSKTPLPPRAASYAVPDPSSPLRTGTVFAPTQDSKGKARAQNADDFPSNLSFVCSDIAEDGTAVMTAVRPDYDPNHARSLSSVDLYDTDDTQSRYSSARSSTSGSSSAGRSARSSASGTSRRSASAAPRLRDVPEENDSKLKRRSKAFVKVLFSAPTPYPEEVRKAAIAAARER